MRKCKCGWPLVQSPMNPRVYLCECCLRQKVNCECEKLGPVAQVVEKASKRLFDAVKEGWQ